MLSGKRCGEWFPTMFYKNQTLEGVMKKFASLLLFVLLVVSYSAPASAVEFRTVVDHWDTEAEALAVPVEVRPYYVPYFNLHDPSKERLVANEELYQIEEDYLLHEKTPERLGGMQFVFGKEGDWYVRDITSKKIIRDPRCGNLIDSARPITLTQEQFGKRYKYLNSGYVRGLQPQMTQEVTVNISAEPAAPAATPPPAAPVAESGLGFWTGAALGWIVGVLTPHVGYQQQGGGYYQQTEVYSSSYQTGSNYQTGGRGHHRGGYQQPVYYPPNHNGRGPGGHTGPANGGGGQGPGGRTGNAF